MSANEGHYLGMLFCIWVRGLYCSSTWCPANPAVVFSTSAPCTTSTILWCLMVTWTRYSNFTMARGRRCKIPPRNSA